MLTGNALDHRHVDLFRDLLELLHPLDVNVAVLGVVCQIPSEKDEVWALRQAVDQIHRALESLGSEWIRRAVEANVGIAQLNKRKRGYLLAVLPPER